MSVQGRIRVACAGFGLLLFCAGLLHAQNPPGQGGEEKKESSITFDGAQGANPSSPAGGKITATGVYTLGQGAVYVSILVKYRLQGTQGWYVSVANHSPMTTSWDKTVTGLAAGTYELHAVLRVNIGVTPVDYSTPDTRTITVAAP